MTHLSKEETFLLMRKQMTFSEGNETLLLMDVISGSPNSDDSDSKIFL